MPKDPLQRTSLRHWFSAQSKFSNLREMASALGIPFDTLRGYFSGKRPNQKNLARLTEVTGLDLSASTKSPQSSSRTNSSSDKRKEAYAARILGDLHYDLTKCLSSLLPAQKILAEGTPETSSVLRRKAQSIQALMDSLERHLEPFIENQDGLRLLRQIISGNDAGYLSGLLGAIFDDRRLQTWKQMTTYKYGSR